MFENNESIEISEDYKTTFEIDWSTYDPKTGNVKLIKVI